MTAIHSPGAPEGVAQDVEAPAAEQATVGPLTGDPAIVGVPTFVVGSVMLGLALINYAPAAGCLRVRRLAQRRHRREAVPARPPCHYLTENGRLGSRAVTARSA